MEYEGAHSWSIRNIAEYAYCPRLFYLVAVEGLNADNEHTVEGKIIHKTVDKPTSLPCAKNNADKEAAPQGSIRSLTLYDKDNELMGILDYVEFDGDCAVPVEYRKGRAPSADAELWEVDRIQLGLQAHLLTSAGYHVKQVGVYYSQNNEKRYFPADEILISKALEKASRAKKAAESSIRPEPTKDMWKCDGCSLAEACLPFETSRLLSKRPVKTPYPPRMDGLHVIAQTDGVGIGCCGNCLIFRNAEMRPVKELPLAGMESLTIYGNVQVSTQALSRMAAQDVHVTYATNAGKLLYHLDSGSKTGVHIRKSQFEKLSDQQARLELARSLIAAKISNQRTILLRNAREERDAGIRLKDLREKAESAPSMETLRGIEGAAARTYFQGLAKALKNDEIASAFAKNGRKRRPAPDPFNACLSFCYALLANECTTALTAAHLDPGLGALHEYRPGRPALACDVMEVFRPLIADSVALSLVNKRLVKPSDFKSTAEGTMLGEHGRTALFSCMEKRMRETVTHPVFDYKIDYRRMIHLHAKLIAGWMRGDYDSLHFLMTR